MSTSNIDSYFLFQEKYVKLYLYIYGFFILIYTAFNLNLFLTSDQLYSFRPDNFWSYTSSIFRRGLAGEIIYRAQLLTGNGIYLFSLAIWLMFALSLMLFLKEVINERLRAVEIIFLILSPFILLYSIDTEIFCLLPFLTLFSKNEKVRNLGTLCLIIISVLFREFSLLLYFPVILHFILKGSKGIKISYTLAFLFILFVIFMPKPTPTYILENTIWNDLQLRNTNLYKFTEMSLKDVLPIHIGFISEKWHYFITAVICFILFTASTFYAKTKSIIGVFYLLITIAICFILTVDYGRYFYLFLIFYFIASNHKISSYFCTFPQSLQKIDDIKLFHSFFTFVGKHKLLILIIATLAPSGYWSGEYQIKPRFITLLAENDFLRMIYFYFN